MDETEALRIAIQLVHVPSRVRQVRQERLPEGILLLLQVAAGDKEAIARAAILTGRPAPVAGEAAAFFIEQILLAPGADSYRVLGGAANTDSRELRRHMTLLLKWLHPDVQRLGERSIFAKRVSLAWNDLKTPERRAAYDRTLRASRTPRVKRHQGRVIPPRHGKRRRLIMQILILLLTRGMFLMRNVKNYNKF